jgi:hypothetical protein
VEEVMEAAEAVEVVASADLEYAAAEVVAEVVVLQYL